jgi:hypothetical protein
MSTPKIRLTAALALFVIVLSACGQEEAVSKEEAEEAFLVAFGSAYVGSMALQFGQPLPGVTLDTEDNAVVFEEFDVSDLQTEYTSLSGRVITTDESAGAEFTLTGGPIKTISFDLSVDQMSAEDGLRTTVVVDGQEIDIELEPNETGQ